MLRTTPDIQFCGARGTVYVEVPSFREYRLRDDSKALWNIRHLFVWAGMQFLFLSSHVRCSIFTFY